MTEHTPIPWEVKDFRDVSEGRHDDVFVAAATTPDHPYYNRTRSIEILSEENYPRKRADAAFIVRAANCHYEMLAALKEVLRVVEHPASTVSMPHTVRKIKQAITNAERTA